MQKTKLKKALLLLLSVVLIAAIALFVGCGNTNTPDETEAPVSTTSEPSGNETVVGEGEAHFAFKVTDSEGKETSFTVKTDKKTVGEALLDAELIAGDASEFGLYVKTVNGITLDYDKDGAFWAFYIDGAYASSGVDSTEITEGSVYEFKAEKA